MGIKLGTSLMKRPHTDQMCQPLPPFRIPLPSSLCSHHVLAHLTPPPPHPPPLIRYASNACHTS